MQNENNTHFGPPNEKSGHFWGFIYLLFVSNQYCHSVLNWKKTHIVCIIIVQNSCIKNGVGRPAGILMTAIGRHH